MAFYVGLLDTLDEYERENLEDQEQTLLTEAIAFLDEISQAQRANWKYRVQEGLLIWNVWVDDEIRPGELVARTCAVGAAAPLHLVDGDAETALFDALNDGDVLYDDLSDAYESLAATLCDTPTLVLRAALHRWEKDNGEIPLPELPASLKS